MIDKQDYAGWRKWSPTLDEWAEFEVDRKVPFELTENEYLLVYSESGELCSQWRWQDGKLHKIGRTSIKAEREKTKEESSYGKSKEKNQIYIPRNDEQICAFDMMKDDLTTIKLVTGGWGCGKAQPITTVIPTPIGDRQLKDLRIGDYVFDRQGNPTRVLNIFPQGKLEVYKLTLADGRSTLCGPDHLWTVKSHSGPKKTLREVTTKEMFEKGVGDYKFSSKYGKKYIDYKWHLPMSDAVEYSVETPLPMNPYVVGCFLGDGCCTEPSLTISSNDEFIPQEIARLLGAECAFKKNSKNFSWGFRLPIADQISKKKNFQTEDVFGQIPELIGDCFHKRIPECYFMSSIEDRFNLLQGLLDTDGSVSKDKARVTFSGQNIKLCEDVVRLVRSLGMRCRLSYNIRKATNKKEYHVHITATPEQKLKLFRLPRKLNRIIANNDRLKRTHSLSRTWNNFITVVNIEKLNYQEEMLCIYVDNDEHLYLTNDFIVTHNTMILVAAALEALKAGRFEKIVWIRNNVRVKDTEDLGALPGEVNEKLLPYLGPFIDHCGNEKVITMLNKGSLEIEPLQSLRGRNLKNTLIMCSEAENLTKEHIQLIIARAAEGSEVWFDADTRQRDKASFEKSKGIETLIERLQGNKLFGYVKLIKSERSETAALADLLN